MYATTNLQRALKAHLHRLTFLKKWTGFFAAAKKMKIVCVVHVCSLLLFVSCGLCL